MRKLCITLAVIFSLLSQKVFSQKVPTGNPEDFKVKTCLHSVSYAGFWRGQARLSVDEFLVKAKQLGFNGIMLMASRVPFRLRCSGEKTVAGKN